MPASQQRPQDADSSRYRAEEWVFLANHFQGDSSTPVIIVLSTFVDGASVPKERQKSPEDAALGSRNLDAGFDERLSATRNRASTLGRLHAGRTRDLDIID